MDLRNRPLDFEWLRDFVVLAETGNFSRAAKDRSIAQPAFSRHIRALEEWVGVELVDRSTHPSSLTEAGKNFLGPVIDLLERVEQARQKALAGHDLAARVLRFAATHALSLAFFPAWLSGMEDKLRVGPIQMISDNFRACEELLIQGQVQFLLCHGHASVRTAVDEAGFPCQVLKGDVLVPVSAPNADGQPRYRMVDGQPGTEPVLMYDRQSGLGHIVHSLLKDEIDERSLNVVFTSHHAVLLKTMALEGRGMAWLPRSLIQTELTSGALVEAAAGLRHVTLEIRLFRQKADLPGAAQAVWEEARGDDVLPALPDIELLRSRHH